jgi:hypothetical protein
MKIGPRFDSRRVQRNRLDAATGAAIGRRGFLATTLAARALATTRARAVNQVDPANLFALNATIRPA